MTAESIGNLLIIAGIFVGFGVMMWAAILDDMANPAFRRTRR